MQRPLFLVKLFIFFFIFFIKNSNAQITAGNWMVGGTGYFEMTETKYQNGNSETTLKGSILEIYPTVGFFLFDKFSTGLGMSFRSANSSSDDNTNLGLGFGPFVRYYFLKPEKLFNVFGEASFSYSIVENVYVGRRDSFFYDLKAGGVIFLNESVGLELTLNHRLSKDSNKRTNSDYGIGLGFQIHLD